MNNATIEPFEMMYNASVGIKPFTTYRVEVKAKTKIGYGGVVSIFVDTKETCM